MRAAVKKKKKRSETQATNCFVINYGISFITRVIRKFYVLGPVHTNSFSLSSKTHPSIRVPTTVLIRLRPSTQKRSKTVESHVVTYFGSETHFDAFSTHFVRTYTICIRFRTSISVDRALSLFSSNTCGRKLYSSRKICVFI